MLIVMEEILLSKSNKGIIISLPKFVILLNKNIEKSNNILF